MPNHNDQPIMVLMHSLLLMALLFVAIGAFANDDSRAAVSECADLAELTQEINLSSGVYTERAAVSSPLKIEIPIGINRGGYADCLERRGFPPETTVEAVRQHEQDCRAQARTAPKVRISKLGKPNISGTMDNAVYSRCLEKRIEVEVTVPAED